MIAVAGPAVSACILAGGQARRLGGRAKPLIEIDGATILDRQLAVLAPRVDEVVVSVAPAAGGTAGAAPWPVAPAWAARVRWVADATAGDGPLAGIAAALSACRTPWVVVVAGDLPWLAPGLIDLLVAEARAAGGDADAIAPRLGGLPEPLLAAYAAPVGAIAARRIAAGRRKASGLLTDEGLRVRWLDEATLRAADPALASLRDIDTPADLQQA